MARASMFAVMSAFSLLAMLLPFTRSADEPRSKPGRATARNNFSTDRPASDNRVRGSLIGATVYNEKSLSIGVIDDILLAQTEPTDPGDTLAVLEVGPCNGAGGKLIKVPYHHLRLGENGDVLLPGVTKELLKSMNDYRYRG